MHCKASEEQYIVPIFPNEVIGYLERILILLSRTISVEYENRRLKNSTVFIKHQTNFKSSPKKTIKSKIIFLRLQSVLSKNSPLKS